MGKSSDKASKKKSKKSSRRSSPGAGSSSGPTGLGGIGAALERLKLQGQRWQIWLQQDQRRSRALAAAACVLLVLLVVAWRHDDAQAPALKGSSALDAAEFDLSGDDADMGIDGDAVEEAAKPKPKPKPKAAIGPSRADFESDLAAATGMAHAVETPAAADAYNVMLRPMVLQGKMVICPDKGGGKFNKICSKAYAEYLFTVPRAGTYYVYVEAVAPNINDNSLWVGAPDLDTASYTACPAAKAGNLVPHKHVKAKKWLCCPKYLDANARKGNAAFYCQCCIDNIGPFGEDLGCVLDLEVDSKPHWNLMPRALKVTATDKPVAVRLYAREDGTGVTRIMLSSNPALKTIA